MHSQRLQVIFPTFTQDLHFDLIVHLDVVCSAVPHVVVSFPYHAYMFLSAFPRPALEAALVPVRVEFAHCYLIILFVLLQVLRDRFLQQRFQIFLARAPDRLHWGIYSKSPFFGFFHRSRWFIPVVLTAAGNSGRRLVSVPVQHRLSLRSVELRSHAFNVLFLGLFPSVFLSLRRPALVLRAFFPLSLGFAPRSVVCPAPVRAFFPLMLCFTQRSFICPAPVEALTSARVLDLFFLCAHPVVALRSTTRVFVLFFQN
jgi:hypothetical protein